MGTSSAAFEQRWGFLLPWCAELQGRVKYEPLACENTHWDDAKVRLQVTLPSRSGRHQQQRGGGEENLPQNNQQDNFQVRFQRVREALALLSVLSHVDFAAWRFLLAEHCGVDMKYEGMSGYGDKMEATFVLFMDLEGREGQENNQKKELDVVKFCGVEQLLQPSEEYLDAMQKIADYVPQYLRGKEVQVPVRVDTASCNSIPVTSLLAVFSDIQQAEKQVKEEWEGHKTKKSEAEALRCRFVLEPMIADATGCMISAAFAQALKQLVSENVWTSYVALGSKMMPELENDKRKAKVVYREVMASLFDSTRRSRGRVDATVAPWVETVRLGANKLTPCQLGSVHIECKSWKELDMDALFSAAAVSQTAKKFSMNFDMKSQEDRRVYGGGDLICIQLWKWVAYAFFSKRALSSVETLELTQLPRLSDLEVEAVKSIVTSDHPEEELFGTAPGRVIERTATLRANAPIRWKFDERGHVSKTSQSVTFVSAIPLVRTFSDDGKSDWVNVLIPGLGRGLVQRADLMISETNQPSKRPRGVTALVVRIRLTLPFGDATSDLLDVIGPSLKYLTLDGASECLHEDQIVQQCPNLLVLSIRKGFMNLQYDLSEYRAKNLPLPSLNFNGYNVEALAAKLRNRSNPITQCIRQLRVRRLNPVDFGTVIYDSRLKATFQKLLRMLKENTRLEYVQVMLSTSYHGFQDNFMKLDMQPIERLQQLPTASKAAFLSVIPARQSGVKKKQELSSTMKVANQFDQHIVSKIFLFAQARVFREVHVFLVHDGIPANMSDNDERNFSDGDEHDFSGGDDDADDDEEDFWW